MKRVFAALGVCFFVILLMAAPVAPGSPATPLTHAVAHAAASDTGDVNDFVITSFTADDTLSTADPQGELRIVEHINVDFTAFNHGILRAIPNSYKKHRLMLHVNAVRSDSGAPAQYSTYQQNGNTVLKIGDPSRTVTGSQEYTVDYTVRNVITFYGDHDELFWDINGDQWQQTFDLVKVTLHVPGSIKQNRTPICYAGSYADTSQGSCVAVAAGQNITAYTTHSLSGYETLSLVAGFDKGVFHPAKWYETLGEYGVYLVFLLGPIALLAGTTGVIWFRHGRDPKGSGVIVPQYDPPEGFGPLEVGTLIDFTTDNKDITATIISLAIRRYLTIIEHTQNRALRRDLTTYTLRLEKADFGALSQCEAKIMTGLFGDAKAGHEIDLSALKFKLSTTAKALRSLLNKYLTDEQYFRPSLASGRNLLLGVGCIVLLLAALIPVHYYNGFVYYWIGVAVGGAAAAAFIYAMKSRTAKGVAAHEHILGLKMYLQVAEKDRIQKLQSPNAAYTPKGAPTHTVELFEKLLPYAMILGVENEWAKQFQDIYKTPPDWYSGNWNTFSIVYFTSSLGSGIGSQVNSAFTAPGNASGSGFGGGGAGGGGGGGGGGGW